MENENKPVEMDISAIMDLAYKCETYRKVEREHLRGVEATYSCSEETQEALEEADATGHALEKFQTNVKECEDHDAKYGKIVHEHVLTCEHEGCTALREFRNRKGVEGY